MSSGSEVQTVESVIDKNIGTVISLAWGTILTVAGWARHRINRHEDRIQALESKQVVHAAEQSHMRVDLTELKTTTRDNHNELTRLIERLSDKLDEAIRKK